jgi:hypothetical protein
MFDWHAHLEEHCPVAREPEASRHEPEPPNVKATAQPRRKVNASKADAADEQRQRTAPEAVTLYDENGYSTLAHVQGGHGGLAAGESVRNNGIFAAIVAGTPSWFALLAVQVAVSRPERQTFKPSLLRPAAMAEAARALREEGRHREAEKAGKAGYFKMTPRVAEPRREVHELKDVPWQNERGYWHPWAGNGAMAGKFAAMPARQQSVIRSLTRAWFGDRTISGTMYPQWMNPTKASGGKRKAPSTDRELVAQDGGGSHELAGRSRVFRVAAARDAEDRGTIKEWIELATGSLPAWWSQLPEARAKPVRKSRATVEGPGRGKPAKHASDEERRAARAAAARERRAAEKGA